MLLYEATNSTTYSNIINSFLTKWRPGSTTPYTNNGTLAYLRKWGSLRYAGIDVGYFLCPRHLKKWGGGY